MFRIILLPLLFFSLHLFAQQPKPLVNSGETLKEGYKLLSDENYKGAISKFLQISPNDTNYTLMLNELSVAYMADSQFESAIKTIERALQKPQEHEANLYINLGNAYNKLGKTEKAIEAYDKGLSKYPYDYVMQYNKGYAYYKNEEYQKAFDEFVKVFDNNPWHGKTHFFLAMLELRQGHTTHAMLSLATSLLGNPGGSDSKSIVGLLESISLNEQVVKPEEKMKSFMPNDFDELDQIIQSKIALNKDYKSEVKVNAALAKQLQMLFEKMKYDSKSKDYWMKTYVPLYTRLSEKGLLQPFIYSIISSVGLPEVDAYVKKNETKIKLLYTTAAEDLNKMRETKTVSENGQQKKYSAWYANQRIEALGNVSGGDVNKKIGYWRYYHPNGRLSSEGAYSNTTFKKTGVWKEYDKEGRLHYEYTLKEGELNGMFKQFNANGSVKIEAPHTMGKPNGEVKLYFTCGALSEEMKYVSGAKTGKAKSYYGNGQVQSDYAYKDGLYEGPFTTYYISGAKRKTGTYKGGKMDGKFTELHENGKVASSGQYALGNITGLWKYYHENGKIASEINYGEGGKFNGTVKRFYANGNPRNEEVYAAGSLNGICKYFDDDGKLHYNAEYKKGKLLNIEFFDKAGKSISKSTLSSGVIAMKTFYPHGTLKSEGKYKAGDTDGEWKYYHRNGILSSISNYKDGVEQGKYTEYHENGKVKVEITMKDGNNDGYYKSWYANGQLESEGWFVQGTRQGDWHIYFPNGTKKRHLFYIDGEIAGTLSEYSASGKVKEESIYENGIMIGEITYDSTGAVLTRNDWPTGTGEVNRKYKNGDPWLISKVLCGEYHGTVTWYYPGSKVQSKFDIVLGDRNGSYASYYQNGQVHEEGKYVYGDRAGKWNWYYKSGKLNTMGGYLDNKRDSVWTWYYENGKEDASIYYKEGKRFGFAKYYDEFGELIYEKQFTGYIDSYRYLNANGELTDYKQLPNSTGKLTAYFKNRKKSAEEEYKSGFLEGKVMEYYSNGNVRVESNYKDTELHGSYKLYYSNGKIREEENYYHGYLHGVCKYYREDGTLERTVTFIMGRKYGKEDHYDTKGKVERTVMYWDDEVMI